MLSNQFEAVFVHYQLKNHKKKQNMFFCIFLTLNPQKLLVMPLSAIDLVEIGKTHQLVCIATSLKHFWFTASSKIAKKEQKILFFCIFNFNLVKKLIMHTNQCVLPIPTNSMALRGITNIFYKFTVRKMHKIVFFGLKTAKNPKISREFFCFFLTLNSLKMLVMPLIAMELVGIGETHQLVCTATSLKRF